MKFRGLLQLTSPQATPKSHEVTVKYPLFLLPPRDATRRSKQETDCIPQVRTFCCAHSVVISPVPVRLEIIRSSGNGDRKRVKNTEKNVMFCSNKA